MISFPCLNDYFPVSFLLSAMAYNLHFLPISQASFKEITG